MRHRETSITDARLSRRTSTMTAVVIGILLLVTPAAVLAHHCEELPESSLRLGFNGQAFLIQNDNYDYLIRFIEEYEALGAQSIRLGIDWKTIEPVRGARYFHRYSLAAWDYTEIVTEFHEAGIEVQGLFNTAPNWMLLPDADPSQWVLTNANKASLTETVRETLVHFYMNGCVKRWEFLNEPSREYADSVGMPERYADWFAAFLEGVDDAEGKLSDRGHAEVDFEIAMGAVDAVDIENWVNQVLARPNMAHRRDKIDAIAFHPYDRYGNTWPSGLNETMLESGIAAVNAAHNNYGLNLEIWITEFGYNDESGKTQLDKLCYAVSFLDAQPAITHANLHLLHDIHSGDGCRPDDDPTTNDDPNCYGLIDNNFIAAEYDPDNDRKEVDGHQPWNLYETLVYLIPNDPSTSLRQDGTDCAASPPQLSLPTIITRNGNTVDVEFEWGEVNDPLNPHNQFRYHLTVYNVDGDGNCNTTHLHYSGAPELGKVTDTAPGMACGTPYCWVVVARSDGSGVPSESEAFYTPSCSGGQNPKPSHNDLPDLDPGSISIDTQPISVGDQVFLSAIVRNGGNAESDTFEVRWLIDDEVLSSYIHDGIPPGQSSSTATGLLWTATEGNHKVTFEVDPFHDIDEWNENNNRVTRQVKVIAQPPPGLRPDLTPTEILHPEQLLENQMILFDSGVENRGQGDAGIFDVRWLVDGQDIGAAGSHAPVGARQIVLDGNSQLLWQATLGTHEITFEVDTADAVQESREDNNSIQVTVIVEEDPQPNPLADLRPKDISFTGELVEGQEVLFDSGVANLGNADTGIFNVKWLVDGQDVGAAGSHDGVPAGTTVMDGNSAFPWVAVAGTHTITFAVDYDNLVEEQDETNNDISLTVEVQGPPMPDLRPEDITFTGELVEGQEVLFDSGVANLGNADTGIFNVKWLVDGQDVGAAGSHDGVPAGTTVMDGNSAFPWVAVAGTHTITFAVDYDNLVEEQDEANNDISLTIEVQGPQMADLRPEDITFTGELVEGQEVFFDSGVGNLGNAPSGIFNVKWLVDGQDVGAAGSHGNVPAGTTVMDGNSYFLWTVDAGSHEITFIVDYDDQVAEQDESNNDAVLSIEVEGAPRITNKPFTPRLVPAGYLYTHTVEAEDPNNDSLSYVLTQNSAGMSIDSTGTITWSAPSFDVGRVYPAAVEVSDGTFSDAHFFDVQTVHVLFSIPPQPVGSAFLVRNRIDSTGGSNLVIYDVSLTGPDGNEEISIYDDQCSGMVLPPGTSCYIYYLVAPTSSGTKAATVIISSNDSYNPMIYVGWTLDAVDSLSAAPEDIVIRQEETDNLIQGCAGGADEGCLTIDGGYDPNLPD